MKGMKDMIGRREFLATAAGAVLMLFLAKEAGAMSFFGGKKTAGDTKKFPFVLSDGEWKKRLSPEAYNVLRHGATERAFTSPLNAEKRKGVFHCAGCDWDLFLSEHKFDSGTGWPSFWQPASGESVGTSVDNGLFVARTEVHCANCGGHLGHVFEDGPQPTGLRYCINGVALSFAAT